MPSKCVTWGEVWRGSWDLLSCFGVRPWNQLCAGGSSLGRFFSLLWLVGRCLGTWLVEQEQLLWKLAFLGDWFTALLGKIWSNRFFPPHQGIEAALRTPGFFREWCARMICRLQEEQWTCKLRECMCYTKIQPRQIVCLFHLLAMWEPSWKPCVPLDPSWEEWRW